MVRSSLVILGAFLAAALARSQSATQTEITSDDLRRHMQALCADSMQGRGLGTPGETRAAHYIADQFKALGLAPPSLAPSYLQRFQFTMATAGSVARTKSERAGKDTLWSQNVIGFVRPERPIDSLYLIIGAHYDHLGHGPWYVQYANPKTTIFHGADDNASGVALLLELAEYFVAHRALLKRPIVFVAFGANEEQLSGSLAFVRDPVLPFKDIQAMLELHMIGRYRDTLHVSGFSTSSAFESLRSDLEMNAKVVRIYDGVDDASDGWSFAKSQVPMLAFSTGYHADYHSTRDELSLINYSGMMQVGETVTAVAMQLANAPDLIPYSRKP